MDDILLHTDVYKMSHGVMMAPNLNKMYSYLTTRSDKKFNEVVFFGLQYYLKKYLEKPITPEMGEEFLEVQKAIVGEAPGMAEKIRSLCKLGYWPLKIKAVEEGSVLPKYNALMTITNIHPDFAWTVGFVESLLLKVWYTCTVSTQCLQYRRVLKKAFEETVDDDQSTLLDFLVHDFGYRGDTSEEGSGISGVAHLCSFLGSDTVMAHKVAKEYYHATEPIMLSVPASEHSVMCSYERNNEFEAFSNILRTWRNILPASRLAQRHRKENL